MSFEAGCVQFGDELAQLVDAGVPAKDAATAPGLPRDRPGDLENAARVTEAFSMGLIRLPKRRHVVAFAVGQPSTQNARLRYPSRAPAWPNHRLLTAMVCDLSTARAAREVGVHFAPAVTGARASTRLAVHVVTRGAANHTAIGRRPPLPRPPSAPQSPQRHRVAPRLREHFPRASIHP